MTQLALILLVTFAAGLLATLVRLPALLGFLAAGFALKAVGMPQPAALDFVANVGVTILLFGIGLKLDVRQLFSREVYQTSLLHMAISVVLGTGFLWLVGALGFAMLGGLGLHAIATVAFALSFSSTVFVVKALEDQAEVQSFYGRLAVGVLVVQDLAAVVFLLLISGSRPRWWALPALLVLIPVVWLVRRLWSRTPHDELRALFGLGLALGPGYALFEALGLKGDLGALVMGLALSGTVAAAELSHTLFGLKDLLLVAFFVSIGYVGTLSWHAIWLGVGLLVLIPVQVAIYIALFYAQKLRRRTSVKAGLLLGNYSEFGLIVTSFAVTVALLDQSWLAVMAVAVAASFALSTALNGPASEPILRHARHLLPLHPPQVVHQREKPIVFPGARALVMGMGRIGRSAYAELSQNYALPVVGVESDPARVVDLRERGFTIIEADAVDGDFWHRLDSTEELEIVVLAMPFHGTNRRALELLQAGGYRGVVAAIAQYDDQVMDLREQGADVVVQVYEGAGASLAEEAALASGH